MGEKWGHPRYTLFFLRRLLASHALLPYTLYISIGERKDRNYIF